MADNAPASIGGYKLNHTNKLEICTNDIKDVSKVSDPTTTWAQLAKGINNITFAENDTTANDEYYDGEGFGQSDVTSKRIQLTIAGHRAYGDPAQDYVAGKQYALGDDLKTLLRFTYSDGTQLYGVVTLTNIVATGGQPGAKQTFSFVAVFNGKPQKGTSTTTTTGQTSH